jgi:tetratricopeptide (TPR) repeat protein
MNLLARIAFAAGLAFASPFDAGLALAQGEPAFTFSAEERAALRPIQAAIDAKDWATGMSLLPAGIAAAEGADARYAIGRFQVEIGLGLNDTAMQAQGLENLIASGRVPAADLPVLYRNQGVLANAAGDKAKAEAAFARVVELVPDDAEALVTLAQVKNDRGKPAEAVQLMRSAIDAKTRAGQAADESWYKYALKIAYDGRAEPALAQAAQTLSRQLVAAHPTPENRRDALLIYRDTAGLDPAAELDLLRLMRASGALAGERDWYDLANGLYLASNYGEAKAVLDDGIARRAIDPARAAFAELIRLNDARLTGDRAMLPDEEARAMAADDGALALRLGDVFYGYGEHARAIALYRAALAKGGVDANVVNTRLGAALYAAGDRAGAEAAFKAVAGPRAPLGAFWLAWIGSAPR